MVERENLIIDLLGNSSRLKILLALWRSSEELTPYKISRLTGLKRSSVRYHLKKLVDGGLIKRITYMDIPLFKINYDCEEGKAISEFFKKLAKRW